MKTHNLANSKVGYLTMQSISGKDKWGYNLWECICICGNVLHVRSSSLAQGTPNSCGCKFTELQATNPRRTTHGLSRVRDGKREHSTYAAYHNAKTRCTNADHNSYKNYGGRGIKFLFTSFEQFLSELGIKPKGKTLDRKENNGNYEPGNVQWSTPKEQAANTRRKRLEQFSNEELQKEINRREVSIA
jgi:hypothetical protein